MILLLDNYDSFTWNLHHYLAQLTSEEIVVKRNDEISMDAVSDFKSIILSPGPGLPSGAGIMPGLIKKYCHAIPILGICLGHQAIGEAFGAALLQLPNVLHGVQREVTVEEPRDRLFDGIPGKISTGHYHSWILSPQDMPSTLRITAKDTEGNVMAISHRELPVSGVQFHPESIMTGQGMKILDNWLRFCNYLK